MLRKERMDLKNQMEEVVLKDKILWNQKIKFIGVIMWDNSSKIFHRIASGREMNKILNKLENDSRDILDSDERIVEEVVVFFFFFKNL